MPSWQAEDKHQITTTACTFPGIAFLRERFQLAQPDLHQRELARQKRIQEHEHGNHQACRS
jgi:hypothetical protein